MGGGGSESHELQEVEQTFAGEQVVVPVGELESKNLLLAGSEEDDAAGMDGSNDDDDGDNIVAAVVAAAVDVDEDDVDIGKEMVGLYHVVVAFLVETCRNRFRPP